MVFHGGSPRFILPLAIVLAAPAFGSLTFDPTFTSNFTTYFGANAAAAESAFNAAAAIYEAAFSDPITINITVDAVTGASILGESDTPIYSIGWTSLVSAVDADAKSAADFTATGSSGSIYGPDPSGGSDTWWLTRAQEKALGIIPNDGINDGTITVGTGFSYTFDDSGGVAPGTYDLTGVFAHEISEVMGRIGISGGDIDGGPGLTLLDAFSFTGAGARGLGNGNGNYFSINDGSTLLKEFNDQADSGGDSRDWASGTNDSFNAFTGSGILNPVTALDLEELDVLGYDPAAPEPATFALVGAALLATGLLRRRAARR